MELNGTRIALTSALALALLHAGTNVLGAQTISKTQTQLQAAATAPSVLVLQPSQSVSLVATPVPTAPPSILSGALVSAPQQTLQLATVVAQPTAAPTVQPKIGAVALADAPLVVALAATATSKPALTGSLAPDPKLPISGGITLAAATATPATPASVISGALSGAAVAAITEPIAAAGAVTAPVVTAPVGSQPAISVEQPTPLAPKVSVAVPQGELMNVASPLTVGGEVGVAVGAKVLQAVQAAQPEIASARVVVDPAPTVVHAVPTAMLGDGRIVIVDGLSPVDVLFELQDAAGSVIRPFAPPGPPPAIPAPAAALTAEAAVERALEGLDAVAEHEAGSEAASDRSERVVMVQLPLGRPTEPGAVFHWLFEVLEEGVFIGYTWSPDEVVDEAAGTVTIPMRVSQLQGTLFLPASITPGFVANHDPLAAMWSGPTKEARGFGYAGPQFTTFTVVAPQVRERLFVYSPVVGNYAWIDALGVGPVGPPAP